MPLMAWAFKKVNAEARKRSPGPLRAVFLIESPRVCYTMSWWRDEDSLHDFSVSVPIHVKAARWGIAQVYNRELKRAELCSTEWTLFAVSHNSNWGDLDVSHFATYVPWRRT